MQCLRKILLVGLLALTGCASSYSKDQIGFWDQHLGVTAWGVNFVSAYGVLNAGYIQYQRNIDQPLTQSAPNSVVKASQP